MATTKAINLGNNDTTVNVTATGNVVGANIKSKGSATQPVYFDANGVAQNTTYTLGKSVPSDAKFTDTNTTYSAGTGLSLSGTTFSLGTVPPEKIGAGYLDTRVYLNTHPENGGVVSPFINNDIAFLRERGGSCNPYTTNSTDYTSLSLTVKRQYTMSDNWFDGSSSYGNFTVDSKTEVMIIDITMPEVYSYSNCWYIDFGATSWMAKDIELYAYNDNADNYEKVYRRLGGCTNKTDGHWYLATSYTWYKDAEKKTVGGYGANKIRFVLTNWRGTSPRIAQIGLIHYGSSQQRMTTMSRGINDKVYRSISPAKNNNYSLGESSYKWANVYATNFHGALDGKATSAGNADKVNNLTVQTAVPANAKFTDTTYTFDGTYNASTNKAATVSTVTNAINALDVSKIGSDTEYITSITETDGKISATKKTFPTTMTPTAHNQASNTITAMTGYSKASSAAAIAATDSLNTAIGKLEKTLDGKGTYSKPSGGIPATDLATAVQTSLGKADTALQSHQDISGKVNKSGDTVTGVLKFNQPPAWYDGVNYTTPIKAYDEGTDLGSEIVISGSGNTFVGSGEGGSNLRDAWQTASNIKTGESYGRANENTYVTSDSQLYLYANTQTIANRRGIVLELDGAEADNKGTLRPATSDKTINLGTSTYKYGDVFAKTLIVSDTAMPVSKAKITGLAAGTSRIYKDGIAMSNPTTANDVAWIRTQGTGESDTVLEIATGDDGGIGESIVFRGYNTSDQVVYQVDVPKKTGIIALTNKSGGTQLLRNYFSNTCGYIDGAGSSAGTTSRNDTVTIAPTGSGGMVKFIASESMTDAPPNNSHIIHLFWDTLANNNTTSYDSQIAIRNTTGDIYTRGSNASVWRDWRRFAYIDPVITNGVRQADTVGSATKPVYVEDGKLTACTYKLEKDVLSTAEFTDTKNTAGATDTSNKIYLVGATTQAANPQTYSDNEIYATNGTLTTKEVAVGGGSAKMVYNSTTNAIDFIFS